MTLVLPQKSFYWAMLGIVLFCISFPCLYWNEGRAVTRIRTLQLAKDMLLLQCFHHYGSGQYVLA